jgi:hypothetical protein
MIGKFNLTENSRLHGNMNKFVQDCGCDGIETIFNGKQSFGAKQSDLVVGYHLIFYPDWLDFWNQDISALNRKFGSPNVWKDFYLGSGRGSLLSQLHADLQRAQSLGAKYVVFHVSDVSIEEGYTYQWEHTDEAVIDASVELINLLLEGRDYSFEFLMENLQWPGFTFTRPELTEELISRVNYPKKGIMLDTGHLMCTNLELKDQEDGCRYVHRMLDEHGELCRYIRGVHLHQSVTGGYVKQSLKNQPVMKENYYERFAESYGHIGRIDTHQPFDSSEVRHLVERIAPEYLIHEINAGSLEEKKALIKIQQNALRGSIDHDRKFERET